MRPQHPSFRVGSHLDPVSRVVREFEDAWRQGPPLLERFRDRLGAQVSSSGLSELIKADLQNRYQRGERPTAREYLERFPSLAADDGRALSLIYEEYCLRVEAKEAVDASTFCDRYPTWRDSLVSQLGYHRELSRAAELPESETVFPEAGDHFGDYVLVEPLGEGGAARVFLASAQNLGGKLVVLKVSANRGSEPSILGKLDHPHIVPVHSTVVDPSTGLLGLCMPYRPGVPLDRLMRSYRDGHLPASARALREAVTATGPAPTVGDEADRPGWSGYPERGSYAEGVAWLGLKLARALAHAHSRGFFHRDVKPDNVFLTAKEGPQLLDFNLAHDPSIAHEAGAAHRGGTLPYMAREQLEAFLDPSRWAGVGAAADIFSLGLVLREMLTGRITWRPSSNLSLPRAINAIAVRRSEPLPSIREINRRVPHALAAIVDRCLAVSPEDRYTDAAMLADDLGRFLERRPPIAVKNPSRIEVLRNAAIRRRRTLAIAASASVFVFVMVTAAFLLARGHVATPPVGATNAAIELVKFTAFAESVGDRVNTEKTMQTILGRPDALEALEEGAVLKPNSIAIALGRAFSLRKANRLDASVDAYRRVLELDANNVSAYQGWVDLECERGRFLEAIAALDAAIAPGGRLAESARHEIRDMRSRTLIKAGDSANESGQPEAALVWFDRAIESLTRRETRENSPKPKSKAEFDRFIYLAMAHIGRLGSAVQLGRSDLIESDFLAASQFLKKARACGTQAEAFVSRLERILRETVPGRADSAASASETKPGD